MKTKKEFPATHSMATEWFIADKDGNIAVFDFEDDGPVPEPIEYGDSWGSLEDIGIPDEDGINSLELTDEQTSDMLKRFKPISCLSEDDRFDCFVQLKDDEAVRKSFIAAYKEDIRYCLSHKERIYLIDWLWSCEASEEEINKTLAVLKASCLGFYHEYYEPEYLSNDSIYPLYCYVQPYNSNHEIPRRTAVPKHPLKVSQIPEEKRKKLFHVPVKFSECPDLQIAQYVVCKGHIDDDDDIEKDGRTYARFPKTGGGFCYILQEQDVDKDGATPIIFDAEE